MGRHRGRAPALRLRVDPVACEGVGICAHLASAVITVDSWGYPIVPAQELAPRDRRQVEAAVAACPRRALFVETVDR